MKKVILRLEFIPSLFPCSPCSMMSLSRQDEHTVNCRIFFFHAFLLIFLFPLLSRSRSRSWSLGYITQPLYVCVTCHVAAGRELYQKDNAIVSNYFEMDTLVLPQTALFQPESLTHFKPFVVCYPCSIACHGAHDLIELFNRREFRCDCGNQTYCASATSDSSPLVACTLCPRKDPLNERNPYRNRKGEWDQNLLGLFCSCSVTYPPSETRQMFQCLHCQDW